MTDLDLLNVVDFTARSCLRLSRSRLRQTDERPVKAKVQLTQLFRNFEALTEWLL